MLKKLKRLFIFVLIIPFVFLIGCGKGKQDDNSSTNNPSIVDPSNPGGKDPVDPKPPEDKYYNIEVDYKLPEKYSRLLPKISVQLKVGESYALPAVSDEKLNEFFDGYYIDKNESPQKLTDKYSGTADENAKIYAKWKDGFNEYISNEYYTDGIVFQEGVDEVSITSYGGSSSLIFVPKTYKDKPVTTFAKNCFTGNETVEEIVLPANDFTVENNAFMDSTLSKIDFDAISFIGDNAFKNSKIETFVASTMLTNLGVEAFSGCSVLESVDLSNISDEVEILQTGLFKDCTALSSIEFPNSPVITTIGEQAFSGCTAFESFDLTALTGLIRIENNAFEKTELTSVTIPSTITYLGTNVFDASKLSNVTLLKIICNKLLRETFTTYFGELPYLRSITLQGDITEIPNSYFSNLTTLETFVMNDALVSIEQNAFSGCSNLSNITFGGGLLAENFNISALSETKWFEETSAPLILENGTILCYVPSSIETLDLNEFENVTVIWENAFFESKNIKNVVISSKITKICKNAFANCSNLLTVTFDKTGENMLNSIEESAFEGCSSLTTINLEKCTSLISISDYAFMDCSELASLTIPENVQTIGTGAFAYLGLIIDVDEQNQYFDVVDDVLYEKTEDIATNLIYYPSVLQNRVFVIPETVTSVVAYAFCNCTNLQYLYIKTNIDLDDFALMLTNATILSETSDEYRNVDVVYLLDESNYNATLTDGELSVTFTETESLIYTSYMIKISNELGEEHTFIIKITSDTKELVSYQDITEILKLAG